MWFWVRGRPFEIYPNAPSSFKAARQEYCHKIEQRTGGTFTRFLFISFLLSCFSSAVTWLWYVIIPIGSVGTLTSIFNTSILFGYLFSLWLLKDRSNNVKWLALSFSLLGLLFIFISGSRNSPDSFYNLSDVDSNNSSDATKRTQEHLANVLCLFDSILYGLYEAIYKRMTVVGHDLPSIWVPFIRIQSFILGIYQHLKISYYRRQDDHPQQQLNVEPRPTSEVHASMTDLYCSDISTKARELTPKSLEIVSTQSYLADKSAKEEKLFSDGSLNHRLTTSSITVQGSPSSSFLGLQYFCWIGIFTFIAQWPLLPLLYFSGLEVPQVSPDIELYRLVFNLCLNATLSVMFNLSFFLTVTLTSPVFASLGTMVTIPLSSYIDFLVFGKVFDAFLLVGTMAIFISFGLMIYAEYNESQVECV